MSTLLAILIYYYHVYSARALEYTSWVCSHVLTSTLNNTPVCWRPRVYACLHKPVSFRQLCNFVYINLSENIDIFTEMNTPVRCILALMFRFKHCCLEKDSSLHPKMPLQINNFIIHFSNRILTTVSQSGLTRVREISIQSSERIYEDLTWGSRPISC